jgi:hypothetical protein
MDGFIVLDSDQTAPNLPSKSSDQESIMFKFWSMNRAGHPPEEPIRSGLTERRLEYLFWSVGAAIAFLQIIFNFTFIEGDGIAYLDIGDAYMRGDIHNAINAYWSPFYSWIVGLTMAAVKPSAYWELPVLHSVNYVVFLGSMFSFGFLLRELKRFRERLMSSSSLPPLRNLPGWMWVGIGYTLFLWCAIVTIGITQTSPDMCVTLIVYLVAGLTLRMRSTAASRRTAIALGITLGLGYLTKTAMLPIGCAFLLANLVPLPSMKPNRRHVLLAATIFCAMSVPFIIAISTQKNRLTIGDSARLNYSWSVNDNTAWLYWHGEAPRSGVPEHPTRVVLDYPIINEFEYPVSGTFPPWFDPTYWYEGVVVYFDINQQMSVLLPNIGKLIGMFYHFPSSKIITLLCLIIVTISGSRFSVSTVLAHGIIIGPALVASLMYALIVVVARYVGPFDVVIALGLLSGCRFPENRALQRLLSTLVALLLVCSLVAISWTPAYGAYNTVHKVVAHQEPHLHWQIAEALKQSGVRPGDKIAAIGYIRAHAYARLSRTKVVAEMPFELFLLTPTMNAEVISAFSKTGAKAVVAIPKQFLNETPPPGWQRIDTTDAYIYVLQK